MEDVGPHFRSGIEHRDGRTRFAAVVGDEVRVAVLLAVERVVPFPGDDDVFVGRSFPLIGHLETDQTVVAIDFVARPFAIQAIVPRAAREIVVVLRAEKRVRTVLAIDVIAAQSAEDHVVTGTSTNRVTTVATREHVGTFTTEDEVVVRVAVDRVRSDRSINRVGPDAAVD